jgi:predicted nucleotide-binding protein
MKTLVYVVEDDAFLASALSEELTDLGCNVELVADAGSLVERKGRAPNLVVCDLFVPPGALSGASATRHAGHGVEALRRVKRKWPQCRLVLITGLPSLDARKWCLQNGVTYLLKPVTRDSFERVLGLRKLRAFVVHGRNEADRRKAIAALGRANVEPVVLMLQPNRGRTVIEKFESVSDTCDVAVIVWSSDDFGGLISTNKKPQQRARQNVVFEAGYFYGALRRRSGQVAIIEFGNSELPSDLAGVVRIDGARRITKIAEDLKTEFSHLLS